MTNTDLEVNVLLPTIFADFAGWHYDRNLIEGATDQTQLVKLLEEFTELYMAIYPNTSPEDCVAHLKAVLDNLLAKGRIKTDPTGEGLSDAIGDMNVVLVNHAERNGLSIQECLLKAWADIKDRKGKMIDGTFVKEEDL